MVQIDRFKNKEIIKGFKVLIEQYINEDLYKKIKIKK